MIFVFFLTKNIVKVLFSTRCSFNYVIFVTFHINHQPQYSVSGQRASKHSFQLRKSFRELSGSGIGFHLILQRQ